jgi:hypothetical protein
MSADGARDDPSGGSGQSLPPTPAHVVITRFSYRGRGMFKHVFVPPFRSREDPLEPKRLDIRFMLFELVCLPSVLAQAEQDVAWILLVDSELPTPYQARLRSLVSVRRNTGPTCRGSETECSRARRRPGST